MTVLKGNFDYVTTTYQPFIQDSPGEPETELSETLTIALTVLKFLTSTPSLPSQTPSFNTKEDRGKQLKEI